MAIGLNTIIIGASDFIKGISTSEHVNDGGLSPTTQSMNFWTDPGLAYTIDTSVATGNTGTIIASSEKLGFTENDQILVDTDGKIYEWSNSVLLTQHTQDATNQYQADKTFAVTWRTDSIGDAVYISHVGAGGTNPAITRFDTNTNSITSTDWTTTLTSGSSLPSISGFYPVPMMVYERNLYIGQANRVHRVDNNGVFSSSIVSIDRSRAITAMAIHPGNGRIAIATAANNGIAKDRNNERYSVGFYDGFSNKLLSMVPIDGRVYAMKAVDGDLYVAYGDGLGIITSSGVREIRKITRATDSNSSQSNSHNILTSVGNFLMYTDGTSLFTHGSIIPGTPKSFFKVLDLSAITHLTTRANGTVLLGRTGGLSSNTVDFYATSAVTTGSGTLKTNKFSFERPIRLREIEIQYAEDVPDGTTFMGNVFINNHTDGTQTRPLDGTDFGNATGATLRTITMNAEDIETTHFSIQLSLQKGYPIERILIRYDVVE